MFGSFSFNPIASALALAAAAIATAGSTSAAEPQRGAMAVCASDLAKFCGGLEAGGGKRMQCLNANLAQLSQPCAETLQARQASNPRGTTLAQAQPPATAPAGPAAAQPGATAPNAATPSAAIPSAAASAPIAPRGGNMRACRTDLATFCATVQPGGGRKIQCLNDNRAKLSPDCAAAMSSAQTMKQNARAACEADAAKLCAGAKGAARMQCLSTNQAQLTPACADAVSRRVAKAAKKAGAIKQ